MAVIYVSYALLEAQTLLKKQSSFKVFFFQASHCLATVVFIPHICLWWDMYCDGSVTITWSYNIFINDNVARCAIFPPNVAIF